MLKTKSAVKKTTHFAFVLWGERFEEATAAIFATKLRQAGLCVKLVGLAEPRPVGKNGLALCPDVSLTEALALAEKAICIILPCGVATLRRVEADPRIADFFRKAYANGARFVVPKMDVVHKTGLKRLMASDEALSTYEDESNLIVFAESLADRLANVYEL